MTLENPSRRTFLRSSGAIAGAGYLRLLVPGIAAISQAACSARDDAASFIALGPDEARDFTAIAARILPTTDTPGATEAGVIYFIDRAFGAEMAGQFDFARAELAAFNAAIVELHGVGTRFDELGESEQDDFLRTREQTPFFNLVWLMTICGFFGMEKYGGNRDQIGWDLVGFVGDHGPWTYPFGYYDAGAHGESNDGE